MLITQSILIKIIKFEVDFLLQLTFQALPTNGPTLAFASTEFYSKILTLRKLFRNPQTETNSSEDDFILNGILDSILSKDVSVLTKIL